MKIRYLNSTEYGASEDTAVVAVGSISYYCLNGNILFAVPKHLVISEIHENSSDYPPSIYSYVKSKDFKNSVQDADFSLLDAADTLH